VSLVFPWDSILNTVPWKNGKTHIRVIDSTLSAGPLKNFALAFFIFPWDSILILISKYCPTEKLTFGLLTAHLALAQTLA
jgi:hypothetical protein